MIEWCFELSREIDEYPGYRGDYGDWRAIAETEDAARQIVEAELRKKPWACQDDEILVPGDLLGVAVDGEILWENRCRIGEPMLLPYERSAAAQAALLRRNRADDAVEDIRILYGRRSENE
jgi:hypothetical protein